MTAASQLLALPCMELAAARTGRPYPGRIGDTASLGMDEQSIANSIMSLQQLVCRLPRLSTDLDNPGRLLTDAGRDASGSFARSAVLSESISLALGARRTKLSASTALGDCFSILSLRPRAGIAKDRASDGLRAARRHYDQLQLRGDIRLDDAEGEISPRLAFELWAYGEHLHDDAEKAARLARM
jgi:hypothetical protein